MALLQKHALHGAQKANLVGIVVVLSNITFKLPRYYILVIGQLCHVQHLAHQAEKTIRGMGEDLLQIFRRHFQVAFAEFFRQSSF